MNLDDYLINSNTINGMPVTPNSQFGSVRATPQHKVQSKIQKHQDELDSSEDDLDFIIENCPSTKRVRKFFKKKLKYDDTPSFLQNGGS